MRGSFLTARRVLQQLRNDPRTIALMLVVPCVLLGLMAWVYNGTPHMFDRVGPGLLGIFPLVVMFLVTSISTLRERQSGTLERLLTTPLSKGAFMAGYGIAFAAVALAQALVAVAFAVWVCQLDIAGPLWQLVVVAVFDAVLGTALGLLVPRGDLPTGLKQFSDVLPLSYAVDAMKSLATDPNGGATVGKDITILIAFSVVALALGALTLRRRTD